MREATSGNERDVGPDFASLIWAALALGRGTEQKIWGNVMIYELRTYTVKPGTLGDIVKAASTVSRDIRKDDYGKLEGYWSTEIGPLNQVMHMWSYGSFDERAKMRAELAKNPRWTGEYIPLIRPLLVRQDVRLLNAIKPPDQRNIDRKSTRLNSS